MRPAISVAASAAGMVGSIVAVEWVGEGDDEATVGVGFSVEVDGVTSMQCDMFAANCPATSSNAMKDRPGGGPTHHDTTGHSMRGHHPIFG